MRPRERAHSRPWEVYLNSYSTHIFIHNSPQPVVDFHQWCPLDSLGPPPMFMSRGGQRAPLTVRGPSVQGTFAGSSTPNPRRCERTWRHDISRFRVGVVDHAWACLCACHGPPLAGCRALSFWRVHQRGPQPGLQSVSEYRKFYH